MTTELTPAETAELAAALRTLESELMQTLARTETLASTVELDQSAVGRISRVDALQAQKMAEAQRHRANLRLKQVRNALRRFDNDSYGDCPECGELISTARLRARPESALCVACSEERGW